MNRGRTIAFLLLCALTLSLAASGAYALPECGMGINAAPMRMEGCAGGSGCCGCEVETTLPQADFGQMAVTPSKLSPEVFFAETSRSGSSLYQPQGSSSSDLEEEEPSHRSKLYDLYSDYRI